MSAFLRFSPRTGWPFHGSSRRIPAVGSMSAYRARRLKPGRRKPHPLPPLDGHRECPLRRWQGGWMTRVGADQTLASWRLPVRHLFMPSQQHLHRHLRQWLPRPFAKKDVAISLLPILWASHVCSNSSQQLVRPILQRCSLLWQVPIMPVSASYSLQHMPEADLDHVGRNADALHVRRH